MLESSFREYTDSGPTDNLIADLENNFQVSHDKYAATRRDWTADSDDNPSLCSVLPPRFPSLPTAPTCGCCSRATLLSGGTSCLR